MQKNAAHANKNTSDHHKLLFHGDDENENCKTKHRLKKIAVLGASASEFRCKFFQHWELSLLSSSSPITAHSVCKPALSWKYLMVLITCITFFSPLSLSIASFHFNLFFLFSLQLEEPSNPTCSWTKFFVWIFLMTLYYFSPLAIDFMHSSWIIWVTNSVTTRLRTLFFWWNMPVRLHLMKAFLGNYCGLYGPGKEEKRKTKLPQQ